LLRVSLAGVEKLRGAAAVLKTGSKYVFITHKPRFSPVFALYRLTRKLF
jgi:hypothetical protein